MDGEINALIGIKYANVHPEVLLTLPSGLQIFKSKLKAAKGNEVLCIGGPLGTMDHLVANISVRRIMKYLIHSIYTYPECKPKLDYFPVDDKTLSYVDQDSPDVEEIIKDED